MQVTSQATAQFFGPDATLIHDTPCRRCGYNLRGLREDGNCPECGTPVGRSVMGDLLRFADPGWLAQISSGLSMLLWLILFSILGTCVTGATGRTGAGSLFGTVVTLGLATATIIAMWKVTQPDPSGIGEESQFNARRIVRFIAVANVTAAVMSMMIELLLGASVSHIVVAVLGLLSSLLGMIGEWYKYRLFEYLASRVPDLQLASRARWIRWMGVIFLLIGMVAGAMALLAAGGRPGGMTTAMTGAMMAVMAVAAVAGIGFLVYAVIAVFYLVRLRKIVSEQQQLAAMIWSTAPLARRAAPPPPPPAAPSR